jgi:hypothetical protein
VAGAAELDGDVVQHADESPVAHEGLEEGMDRTRAVDLADGHDLVIFERFDHSIDGRDPVNKRRPSRGGGRRLARLRTLASHHQYRRGQGHHRSHVSCTTVKGRRFHPSTLLVAVLGRAP